MGASASPHNEPHGAAEPAPAIRLTRLKKRRDFLACARARKWACEGFVLQARAAPPAGDAAAEAPPPSEARIGFTASKKVGGAVIRNRAKRRLRALVDQVAPQAARGGWDYVLIARADRTVSRDFALMSAELAKAFDAVHAPRKRPSGAPRRSGP